MADAAGPAFEPQRLRIDPDAVPAPGGPHHGATYVLLDADGRILLQQRDDDTPPAGYGRWAVPGGGLEPDETPRTAVLRELQEETGVVLSQMRYFGSFLEPDNPRVGELLLHVFFAAAPEPVPEIQVNEGLDFRFFAPHEAVALPMNPYGHGILRAFLASDHYRHAYVDPPATAAACVIALDRWGRILVQQRDADLPDALHPATWTLPGGGIRPGESPDAAALREFEEETGARLDELRLYRAFGRGEIPAANVAVQHVYYIDADLELDALELNEGQALAYATPAELLALPLTPWTRPILEAFVESPAYRGMFH